MINNAKGNSETKWWKWLTLVIIPTLAIIPLYKACFKKDDSPVSNKYNQTIIYKKDSNNNINPSSKNIVSNEQQPRQSVREAENPDMSGFWTFTIKADNSLTSKGPMRLGKPHIGGTINMSQNENIVTGQFGSRNWISCRTAKIDGRLFSDSIELNFICTSGACAGNGEFKFVGKKMDHNQIVGKCIQTSEIDGKCVLYFGQTFLTRE